MASNPSMHFARNSSVEREERPNTLTWHRSREIANHERHYPRDIILVKQELLQILEHSNGWAYSWLVNVVEKFARGNQTSIKLMQ
ncbi:hypothetical protein NL676_018386 [Syzygium grande]|nr:hypothetical protein NL676_018386 [Syzygium grande]